MRRRQVSRTQTTSLARRFANSGPVLPFNPASIPGCQLWLDAADTSTVALNGSSSVSLWIDKSGNELSVSASSSQPTYATNALNGLGTLAFNGTQNLTTGSVTAGKLLGNTGGSSTFCVFSVSDNTAGSCPISWDDGSYTYRYIISWEPSGIIIDLGDSSAGVSNRRITIPNTTLTFANNTYYLVSFWQSSGSAVLNVNGGTYTITTSSGFTGNIPTSTARTFNVGVLDNAYSYNMKGNTAEILVFNRSLTTTQRQKVEGYLAHKWGLKSTLPSNHPYKTTAPTYEEPVFVPTLISGSQLWLDGMDTSSMTFSGSSVTAWADKSGKGFNVATSSGATAPVYNSSTKELQFVSGNSNSFTIPQGFGDALVGKTFSFFFIGKRTVNTTYAYFLSGATSGGNQNLFIGFFSNKMEIGEYGPYASADIPTFNSPDPMRLYYYDIQTSTSANLLMNGNSLSTTVAGDLFLTSFAQPELGRRYGGAVYHDFNLSEMVVFSPALSETQRKRVEGHLIQKWGLQSSLSAVHPYKTIAPTGIPRSITIQSLSALFNGANNPSLTIPASSVLTLGTNDHTIEFWIYQTSRAQYDVAFSYGNPSLFGASTYFMGIGTELGVVVGNGGGWAVNINGGAIAPLNTWHHYAMVRRGTTFTLYLNGASRGSATSSVNIAAQGDVFRIGNTTNYPITGYISNFRFVNGTAVYTSNFTPPTSPLTAIPNTQVLIQGLVDRSPNAFTLTNNGGVVLSTTVSPFV